MKDISVEEVISPSLYFASETQSSASSIIQPITYERINQTKYRIDTSGNTFPMVMVFNENFNNKWKLYEALPNGLKNKVTEFTQTWFQKILPEGRHFTMYGFANAWYFDKKPEGELILEFYPQKMFYQGIIVSIISLGIVICLYLIRSKYKN